MEPAQIWSAKEAVAKAMGCGFDGVNPLDIRLNDVGLATAREQAWLLWSWRQDNGLWVTIAYQKNFRSRRSGYCKKMTGAKKGNPDVSWN